MFRRRLSLGSESKGIHIFSTIVYPTKHGKISVYLDILSSFENIFWVSIKELKIFRGFVLRQVFNLTPTMGFECSNALQVASSYLTELHKSSVQPRVAKLLDGSRHPQALLHIQRQRQLEKKNCIHNFRILAKYLSVKKRTTTPSCCRNNTLFF